MFYFNPTSGFFTRTATVQLLFGLWGYLATGNLVMCFVAAAGTGWVLLVIQIFVDTNTALERHYDVED